MAKQTRQTKQRMRRSPEAVKLLDLGQFASIEDATEKTDPGDRYIDVGRVLISQHEGGDRSLTMPKLFFMSMLSRSQALHSAISREIAQQNAHAVFPLLRAYAEAVVLLIYVIDHPTYINALTQRPREPGAPKRKSMQALISYASRHAPGMKDVYSDLSEATHFGAVAMWASMTPDPDDDGAFSWSSYPRWRDDQGLVACAQVLELAEAMDFLLRQFAVQYLGVPRQVAFP